MVELSLWDGRMLRTPELDFDEMPTVALEAIALCLLDIQEGVKEDALGQLLEKAVLIEAKKRRGKTLGAVGISWELRERFDRPVVCVGSRMGLNESFGPYQFMSESDFRDEMERINVAASEEENAEQVAKAFQKYGISVLYATLVFDEARKMLDSRKHNDKMVQLVDDYLMQSAHYHTTTIICAPGADELDKRVIRQLDWKGRVYHNSYTDVARIRLVSGIDVLTLDIDGASDVEHVPFYEMYQSWNLIGFKKSSLRIKGL